MPGPRADEADAVAAVTAVSKGLEVLPTIHADGSSELEATASGELRWAGAVCFGGGSQGAAGHEFVQQSAVGGADECRGRGVSVRKPSTRLLACPAFPPHAALSGALQAHTARWAASPRSSPPRATSPSPPCLKAAHCAPPLAASNGGSRAAAVATDAKQPHAATACAVTPSLLTDPFPRVES